MCTLWNTYIRKWSCAVVEQGYGRIIIIWVVNWWQLQMGGIPFVWIENPARAVFSNMVPRWVVGLVGERIYN